MTWLLYQALPSWMCKSILCLMRNQIKLVVIDNDVILWLLWNFDNHKLWGMFEDQQEEWSLFLVLKDYLNFTIRLRGGIMCNTLGRVFHVFIYMKFYVATNHCTMLWWNQKEGTQLIKNLFKIIFIGMIQGKLIRHQHNCIALCHGTF